MPSEDQAARGVAVQAVRKRWLTRQPEAQGVKIVLEARSAFRTGMNRDAGRLVENEHHPVAIDEPRCRFFRGHGRKWYAAKGRVRIGRPWEVFSVGGGRGEEGEVRLHAPLVRRRGP